MIFVTVGTQFPFDRLVAAVDGWAASQPTPPEIVAQVGTGRSDYLHLRCVDAISAAEYVAQLARTRLMIAHAGIGSILSALEKGIPVIIFPRDPRRGEHRDDHQMQTARQMERMGLVAVAWSEQELVEIIDRELATPASVRPTRQRGTDLVDYLRDWINEVLDGPQR